MLMVNLYMNKTKTEVRNQKIARELEIKIHG